jgi:diguanylate cyclase (GGDEF)-like protein/PAS domain S-box-containing protein
VGLNFDFGDRFAISQLVLESNDEIIFKTDRDGFLRDASPTIGQLGFSLVEMLIGPHITDLVDDHFRPALEAAFKAALAGRSHAGWFEFRSSSARAGGRWFAVKLAALKDQQASITGTLGIVRSLGESKQLEERLFRAELTDPLTGLTNRQAWLQMIAHLAGLEARSSLALVDIDFFKAVNLHHGLAAGDRLLVDFADFLRNIAPGDVSISRVSGSRFGLLFAGWSADRAQSVCRELVYVLDSLKCSDWQGRFTITASIGLAPVTAQVDQTVRTAEAALRLARAKGGNTVVSNCG